MTSAPSLFPGAPTDEKRESLEGKEADGGHVNLAAFREARDKLPYGQGSRLGEYFLQVLSEETAKRTWTRALAKARALVVAFYPEEKGPAAWGKSRVPVVVSEPPKGSDNSDGKGERSN